MFNIKKKLKRNTKAGLTAYVMIMFGMIVMLYLFGFTNAWDSYHSRGVSGEENAEALSEAGAIDKNIGDLIVENIKAIFTNEKGEADILTIIVGTVVTLAGMYLASKVGGQYAFAYIIPVVLFIVFSNVFIFPFEHTTNQLHFATIPIDLILIVFFNLFLVLGIIEFVRGGSM